MTRKSPATPLLAWAREQGCDITQNRSDQHWRVTYKGRYVGTIALTPSDHRSMLNAKSLMRRNIAKIEQGQA